MLLLMMVILILLGMVLDPNGIIILCVPIMLPIIKALHFDPFWFAILFNVNIQIAFISPPFGYSLFYLKSVAPPQISLFDTYRAALPFILLQFVGLAICMSFPPLVTWLPNLLTAP
jgi:TRAP-type mannitol/chloroaromatic compound transport system permease large subunit